MTKTITIKNINRSKIKNFIYSLDETIPLRNNSLFSKS